MKNELTTIGQLQWSREEMAKGLEEFVSLYKHRPIKNNKWGMKSPHLFLVWFVLQKLRPKAIIESGVYLGQGTWFLEQACPDAKLYCIDINLRQIKYRAERATYFNQDFSTIDWNHLPKDKTVLLFDDHQNAYERIKTAKFFGFTHLIFDDNYPPLDGDCYSLKKVFACTGFKFPFTQGQSIKLFIKNLVKIPLHRYRYYYKQVPANKADAKYLRQNIDIYCELPPVFRPMGNNWPAIIKRHSVPRPLLESMTDNYQKIFWDEASCYTWMCYVKLKT